MTRPGLERGPFDPESIALTTRPPRLQQGYPSAAVTYYIVKKLIGLDHAILYNFRTDQLAMNLIEIMG